MKNMIATTLVAAAAAEAAPRHEIPKADGTYETGKDRAARYLEMHRDQWANTPIYDVMTRQRRRRIERKG